MPQTISKAPYNLGLKGIEVSNVFLVNFQEAFDRAIYYL